MSPHEAKWDGILIVQAPCCLLNTIMISLRVGSLRVFECPDCLATFTVPSHRKSAGGAAR